MIIKIQQTLKKIIRPSYGLFLLSSISIAGCYGGTDYGHKLPILGDIDISLNDKDNLCFKPLFDTAKLGGGAQQPMPIKYLKMDRLTITNTEQREDGFKRITISPVNSKYFIVKDRQEICVNDENPKLKQEIFAPFEQQETLIVHIPPMAG